MLTRLCNTHFLQYVPSELYCISRIFYNASIPPFSQKPQIPAGSAISNYTKNHILYEGLSDSVN